MTSADDVKAGVNKPLSASLNEDTPRGFAFALTAYLFWGILPYYMKMVAHIPALEVVAHRVIWSIPIAGAVLLFQGRTADIKTAIRTPKMLAMAAVTAGFVSINWLIYVWSITHDRALEAALGYYINPLFSVFMGAVMLKEKMATAQKMAIGLAVIAVAILTWDAGGLPWISLSLAVSWGFYAFFRKTLPIGPNQGFLLEVLILAIPAAGYILYLQSTGNGHFGKTGWHDMALLAFAGLVTAVPLMVYANGAKLLRLSTIGVMQYITPTLVFISAVFVFKEPFSLTKLLAFGFIWAALAIYTLSLLRQRRALRV